MAVEWKKVLLEGDAAELSDVAAVDVGTSASAGTGLAASREDHVHELGADVVTGDNIADDAVGSEHIEQLSAALDFGGNQAQDMVVHTVADTTALNALTAVVGKVAYKSDDTHMYICTSDA